MPKNRGFTPEQMLLGAVSSIVLVVGALIGKFLPDGFGRAFCAGAGFSGILFGIGWLTHRPVGPKPYDYPKGLEAEVPTDPKAAAAAEDLRTARESLANARTAAKRYGAAERQLKRWWCAKDLDEVRDGEDLNAAASKIMNMKVFERSDPEAEGPWVQLTSMADTVELELGRGNTPGYYAEVLDGYVVSFNTLMDQEQAWLGIFVNGSQHLRLQMGKDMLANKNAGRHFFRFPDPPAEPDLLPETQSPLMPLPA